MKLNHITDIFFDLDHTLWDFDKNSALTFEKIFRMNAIDVDLDNFLRIYVPKNLEYWKLYRENKIDKESLRFVRLNDVFTELRIAVAPDMIYKLSEDYIKYLSSYAHLLQGTMELLDYLNPNYNLHIITNGFREVQRRKLRSSNILHYFDTVTDSEMVGVKKPNPKIFHHAFNLSNAIPEKSIMIGDNYEADILGALDYGFDAICYNYHKEDIDSTIKQVNDLLDLKAYF